MKKNPTGIRYDEKKVAFVMEKENLKTVQQVITFLVDKYWWEIKFGANPVLERNRPPVQVQNLTEDKSTNITIDTTEKEKLKAEIEKKQQELLSLNGLVGTAVADRRRFLKTRLETLRTELNKL